MSNSWFLILEDVSDAERGAFLHKQKAQNQQKQRLKINRNLFIFSYLSKISATYLHRWTQNGLSDCSVLIVTTRTTQHKRVFFPEADLKTLLLKPKTQNELRKPNKYASWFCEIINWENSFFFLLPGTRNETEARKYFLWIQMKLMESWKLRIEINIPNILILFFFFK